MSVLRLFSPLLLLAKNFTKKTAKTTSGFISRSLSANPPKSTEIYPPNLGISPQIFLNKSPIISPNFSAHIRFASVYTCDKYVCVHCYETFVEKRNRKLAEISENKGKGKAEGEKGGTDGKANEIAAEGEKSGTDGKANEMAAEGENGGTDGKTNEMGEGEKGGTDGKPNEIIFPDDQMKYRFNALEQLEDHYQRYHGSIYNIKEKKLCNTCHNYFLDGESFNNHICFEKEKKNRK